jgi:uncharacterized delta-60 repeat protein
MKKFTGQRLQNLAGNTGLVKLGLVVLIGLAAASASAVGTFATAPALTGSYWGSVVGTNAFGITPDGGCPSIAGFPPHAPLWFRWTATNSGEVELDTLGSVAIQGTPDVPLDTVLAVYTGTSLATLNQVAANDDLYPRIQVNVTGQNIFSTNFFYQYITNCVDGGGINGCTFHKLDFPPLFTPIVPVALGIQNSYQQPYGGPSGLRFNARAGTTYYIAVDTKNTGVSYTPSGGLFTKGRIVLHWAYNSSGVFRFATENVDLTGMTYPNGVKALLYPCAETETITPYSYTANLNVDTVINTYYEYNVPGVLVTVTRSAGSSGRAVVSYTTVDGVTNLLLPLSTNVPAKAGVDYTAVSGKLVFDDFEMSKTIVIPITDDAGPDGTFPRYGLSRPNRDFSILLTNVVLDSYEDSSLVSPPRVDPNYGQAVVRILDADIDPKGEVSYTAITTNVWAPTNGVIWHTNLFTNYLWTCVGTNVLCNFQKANYRVGRDATQYWGATPLTIYVSRGGTNTTAATFKYRVNSFFHEKLGGDDEGNIYFPLQPGSDYATPDPATNNFGLIYGKVSDFKVTGGESGTISFGANDPWPKPISFAVYDNGLPRFNQDFHIELYQDDPNNPNNGLQVGMVAETTITILYDDLHPPAGSVDELYNADWNGDLALPDTIPFPITTIPDNPVPGTDGEVYDLAILPNNETVIVGAFASYNAAAMGCIALIQTNGLLDTSFLPGGGAGGGFIVNGHTSGPFINAVALASGNKFIIGGDFTAFNGTARNGIARINADGSLDTAFPNVSGTSGADGTVWAVAVQPGGKILIGGDFTHVNGTVRNHLARLNADGSLDTAFDPGTNFTGTIHVLALPPSGGSQIFVGGNFAVGGQLYHDIALVNANGTLNTSFNPGTGADNTVYSLCWQPNGQVILGGAFAHINGNPLNGIARLNADGTIDNAGFFPGTGANGTVDSIIYSTNFITSISVSNPPGGGTPVNITNVTAYNTIYVGGSFTSFNGTHRLGFARLYADGTVDTTFLDTAYNQFAGLPRIYFRDQPGAVFAVGVQSDGNVMIAGSFDMVGGGQADKNVRNTLDDNRGISESFADTNLWVSEFQSNVEPKSRDGVRSRSCVARLIGGSTPGPGNIGLANPSYSTSKGSGFLPVSLVRTNGTLGPASANFSVQPALAQSGADYVYNAVNPLYWITWEYTSPVETRMHSDGLFGLNGVVQDVYGRFWGGTLGALSQVFVRVINDTLNHGNLTASFQLANPSGADSFYLGGENIPLAVALGRSVSPLTLIDNNQQAGTFGFAASTFIATNASAAISVLRSNGNYDQVTLNYSTSDGTAVAPGDYIAVPLTPMVFDPGDLGHGFNVTVNDNGYTYTNFFEKTVNLGLSGLSAPVGSGAAFGISNAVLRLINPNYKGYLSLSTNYYTGSKSAGFINFVVNRTSGSLGSLSVQYATSDGTGPNAAVNGVDYIRATNTLNWSSGDVTPRTVTISLTNVFTISANKQFNVSLSNPALNGISDLSLMGTTNAITNATLVIINDNNAGTLQFSAPSCLVNENGGSATLTVIRTGGAAGPATVNYSTSDGPHAFTGTGHVTTNYAGITNGLLTFGPGEIAKSFDVPIKDDGVPDDPLNNFYFNVALTNVSGAVLGSPTNAQVYILDAFYNSNRSPGSPGAGTNSISGADDTVLALAFQPNGQILVGGDFQAINSVPESYVARLNTIGSLDSTFLYNLAGANGPVQALVGQTDGRILVGGAFTSMDGVFLYYFTRLMTDGSLDSSFNIGAGADRPVDALAETFIGGARKIYIGGEFTSINSVTNLGIARLNNDGTVDTSFMTGLGADGAVKAIAVYPTNSIYAGRVLIGGEFTHYNGTNLNYIARLNADGSLDLSFNPGSAANGSVSAIAIQPDGGVLVGGSFIQFNGGSLHRIARLNADGQLDVNFRDAIGAGANNTVKGIALQPDNRILLVGAFSQFNNLNYGGIVRLLPNGSVDSTINFGDGADGEVDAVLVQPWDGMIVLGGAFTHFNDQPFGHLVRLFGGSKVGSTGGSLVIPAGFALIAESGPTNHIIDPGETNTLLFAFTNSAGNNVSTLYATLIANATNGITSFSPALTSYGPLNVGGPAVSRSFTLVASGTNGQSITISFQLQSDTNPLSITNNLGIASFNFVLGTLTNTFASTSFIKINDNTNATPYPSIINVSGVGGSLYQATVTFVNLAHASPSDICALLVSPSVQSVLLMSGAGDSVGIKGVTLTFNDSAAPAGLPSDTQIFSGTYEPTAFILRPGFSAPAPSAPYLFNMSALTNGNPNGPWSLYIIDDLSGGDGAISNGWSINLITASPVPSQLPSPAQQPQFGVTTNSNGTIQFSVISLSLTNVIQASTNLVNWIPIYTNIGSGSFIFTDPNAASYPYRFYRDYIPPGS